MILLPSRRITKPQAGGSVDIQRAYDTGTLYLSFADATFTDRIRGGVLRNPGGLSLNEAGKIATFNGAQQGNAALGLNSSHVGLIVAARIRATAAQAGTPGAAFGVYDGTSQGGFGVGFDPSGNAGTALLTSGGAYLSSSSSVGLNKWVTVFAQISGWNAGLSVAYVDGVPATTGQGSSYIGDPRSPNEISYGAQHRSSGFLRQFKGDIEWAAILRVPPGEGQWQSLTDSLALELYQSGYPYNLIKTTRRIYFDMGAGGGATGELILAASNDSQLNSGGTGSIELTHELAGSASSQDNAGSAGAMDQALVLVGASSVQANSGSTASLSEVQVSLTGAASAQANAASAGAISQSINLQGGSDIQANTGLVDAIVQAYVLGGASSAQSNLGSTGQIILGDLPEVTEIIGSSRVRVGPAQMASAAPRVGTPSLPVAQPRIGTTTLSTRRPGRMTI